MPASRRCHGKIHATKHICFLKPHRSQLVIQREKSFRKLHCPNIIAKAQMLKIVENLPPDWCSWHLTFAALDMLAHTWWVLWFCWFQMRKPGLWLNNLPNILQLMSFRAISRAREQTRTIWDPGPHAHSDAVSCLSPAQRCGENCSQ